MATVIATKDRPGSLKQTLEHLLKQSVLPESILIVDSSTDEQSRLVALELESSATARNVRLDWVAAKTKGAAPQRNQGALETDSPFLMFLDDDIFFEPLAMERIWDAAQSAVDVVGVTPTYLGDGYSPPGKFGRRFMAFLNSGQLESYAGRVLGPGFTRLPDASDASGDVVEIDWMGTGCALYRRSVLPSPPFPGLFHGASLCEDLCLSLLAGRVGRLVNARTAVVVHAHEGGDHKHGRFRLAKMELINRYYVMYRVLRRTSFMDHVRFFAMMGYMAVGAFGHPKNWLQLCLHMAGLFAGSCEILLKGCSGDSNDVEPTPIDSGQVL